MKMYEPGCSSVYTPLSRSSCHVPVPAPVTTAHLHARGLDQRLAFRARAPLAAAIAAARCLGLAQVLRGAVVRVQAAKAQARRVGDRLRERHRRRARAQRRSGARRRRSRRRRRASPPACDAAADKSRITSRVVDQHADRRATSRGRRGARSSPGATTSLVTSTSAMPAATNAAASSIFWQQMPTAPRGDLQPCAMSGHLCDLACGRSAEARSATAFAMRSRLCSNASRSTTSAGVSTAASGSPMRAGGFCGMVAGRATSSRATLPRHGAIKAGCPTAGRPDACVGYLPCTDAASAAASWPYTRRPIASICARSIWPDSAYAQFSSTQ